MSAFCHYTYVSLSLREAVPVQGQQVSWQLQVHEYYWEPLLETVLRATWAAELPSRKLCSKVLPLYRAPSLTPGGWCALLWCSHHSSESHRGHKLCKSQHQHEPGEDKEASCEWVFSSHLPREKRLISIPWHRAEKPSKILRLMWHRFSGGAWVLWHSGRCRTPRSTVLCVCSQCSSER